MAANVTGVPEHRDWQAVLGSWRLLVNPGKNGGSAFELIVGLAAPILARSYHQLRAHPNGRRLFAEKPDLLALLGDDDYLASLPVGSLGHAYRSFLRTNRLDAGVFDVDTVIRPIAERRGWDDDFFYMIRRGTALHDMFHTLGGYGPDMGGEFGNLGFHCGQMEPSGALKTLTLSGLGTIIPVSPRRKLRYFREAVRRGQRADNLMAAPYEELLDKPLNEVRAQLGVAPTRIAHPAGHMFVAWMPPGMTRPTRWDYDAEAA
ncbi:ubiquinone biosynthesis protein COQ4 [[Mycobacterium] nativiensis]|uniref:Coq4 family protein n=1 Tax=[Mycobacterium] nativiensis TaxID=2855503 RepID=A0ABU5XSP0_9MYCO|nr:ubiquinone biosynthesis protein COQ4 [Mycolicibacter sp. MYC340]MEB3030989.1 Coq4 family protein [Mycolicibacter sp. MYC340]